MAIVTSYVVAGPTLNFFLDLLVAGGIVGPLAAFWRSGAIASALCAAIAGIACAVVGWRAGLAISNALRCAVVILTFAGALAAMLRLLIAVRLPRIVAFAMCAIFGLGWLAAPLWLSAAAMIRWIPIHPLFAINSAAIDLGVWTEQPFAYRLTRLGQDVPYTLPRSILPCGATQIAVTFGMIAIAMIARRQQPKHF